MADFTGEEFAYTKSMLLSDNEMLVNAALSPSNKRIFVAALHIAENVAFGNVKLSDDSVALIAAKVANILAKDMSADG